MFDYTDSKYRDAFNTKVLDFAEQGILEKLKKRWWEENGGGRCPVSQRLNPINCPGYPSFTRYFN